MFQFNPARTIGALGAFLQSIIVLLALLLSWSPELILAVEGINAAFLILFGTLFVEKRSVSVAGLEALAELENAVDDLPRGNTLRYDGR